MVVSATRLRPETVVTRRWRKMVAFVTVLVLAPGFVGLSPGSPRGTSKLVLWNKAGEVEVPPASNKAKDLFVGKRYNATVVKLQDFGAKLKLGVDKPGFLHISKVKPKGEYLANMSDAMALNDVIQVRVLAVKKSRVECVIADQPEFQKRPFSDYQVGDLVEGTVITVRERAAFVDVGAMQQGYLPEENVKGQKLEEGQKIKLKGETVTGCRMTLVVPTNSTAETLPVEAAGG